MSTYNPYPRGAEWRKWDLHVHTPASFHWNDGKCFAQMSSIEKAAALMKMLDTIEKSDVAAFAIMDYWTFDGYLEFRRYLADKKLTLTKAVFPGMELRVEAPVDYRLNIQVILSDKHTTQELNDFKATLSIRSIDRPLSDEALIRFAKTLDPSKAAVHGFKPPENLSEPDLLKLGSMTAEITKESLEDAIKKTCPSEAFIIMPYDTSDGLKDLDWKKHPHADNYFMQTANIIESRDEETVFLCNGNVTEKNKDIMANFQKTLGDERKPVICGSDAHRFADYGVFPGQRATWIKSDPTFEGLRQILYEPSDRVRIQEDNPGKRINYLVIDKVAYKDSIQHRFSEVTVCFNEYLNAIIGGKSSGKSILLYHIAKTIEPAQVETKMETLGAAGYSFESDEGFDFEVTWRDGVKMTMLDADERHDRRITYIPQMYINYLAEEKGEDQLKELIDEILEQNAEYKFFLSEKRAVIQEETSQIVNYLNNIFKVRENRELTLKEIREVGDKKAIKAQVNAIATEIDNLTKSSGFTAEESAVYEKLLSKKAFHDSQVPRFTLIIDVLIAHTAETIDALKKFDETFTTGNSEFEQSLGDDKLAVKLFENIVKRRMDLLTRFRVEFEKADEEILKRLGEKVSKHKSRSKEIGIQLGPFLSKVTNQGLLKDLQKLLSIEQEKITKIVEREKKLAEIIEKEKNARSQLLGSYSALYSAYCSLVEKLSEVPFNKIAELELKADVAFDLERFDSNVCSLFDKRANLDTAFGVCFESNRFRYTQNTHVQNISQIFDKLSQLDQIGLRLKSDYTLRDAAHNLFSDYFTIKYSITQGGDNILRMSPGKRGLVLLQLILHLSNASHPILIDQPEDNLDNRTVYYELNQFIKDKKIQRQIIFVTHNANLVVSTDAENIIVANQAGQDTGNDNKEFQFEYVSGALELSFRNDAADGILYKMGVREHVCEILEGGQDAFEKREKKYGFK